MICKMCKKQLVTDTNPKIHVCELCKLEIMLAFTYHINGKEVTQEEYERTIKKEL